MTALTPDPKPWRQMMAADIRFESATVAPQSVALVFDPRLGYSQNREDYPA